ncbi:biofilm-forming protein [Mesobacillus persicus]|nr:biofilm-forming protein [Mesobacillus persicus]
MDKKIRNSSIEQVKKDHETESAFKVDNSKNRQTRVSK